MIFAMVQEQHQEQLNAMQESNAQAMKTQNAAMAEMANSIQIMMSIMPGINKQEVKNDIKTDTQTKKVKPWNKPGYVKRDQKMCPNLKSLVYQNPEICLKLETNKGKRRDNWKSVLWHGECTWTVVGSKTKT